MKINVRFVVVNGVKHFHRDDLILLLKEFVAIEDTVTRNRMKELIRGLEL